MAGYTEQMLALYKLREARQVRNEIIKLDQETVSGELILKGLSNEGSEGVLRDRLIRAGLRTIDPDLKVPWFAEVDEIGAGEPTGHEDELREMLEKQCALLYKEKSRKKSLSKRPEGNSENEDEEKQVPLGVEPILTSLTVPATSVKTTIAASDTSTTTVYTLAGSILSSSLSTGFIPPSSVPSSELLQRQCQEAQAVMGADKGYDETKKKVTVTTTEFDTSSSEEENETKYRPLQKTRSRLDDVLKKIRKNSKALMLEEKKEASVKATPRKSKVGEKKVPNLGVDVSADKVEKTCTTGYVKRDKDRRKKAKKHAAKGEKKAHASSSSDSESSSESSDSSDSSEEERSRKKKNKKKKTSHRKKHAARGADETSESSSECSESSSSTDSCADTEHKTKGKTKRHERSVSQREPDRSLKVIRILESRKIMFTGDGKEGPEHYLDRLEECKKSYDLSDKELLRAIPTTLSGDTSVWFKTVRDVVSTWKEFKKEFRHRYIGNVVRKDILRDLYNTSQAKGETIDAYLSHFRLIVGYLRKPSSMRKQMDIVWDKLLPKYCRFMVGKRCDDLSDIAKHDREYEEILELDHRYTPPPPEEKMHIKSTAYIGPAI